MARSEQSARNQENLPSYERDGKRASKTRPTIRRSAFSERISISKWLSRIAGLQHLKRFVERLRFKTSERRCIRSLIQKPDDSLFILGISIGIITVRKFVFRLEAGYVFLQGTDDNERERPRTLHRATVCHIRGGNPDKVTGNTELGNVLKLSGRMEQHVDSSRPDLQAGETGIQGVLAGRDKGFAYAPKRGRRQRMRTELHAVHLSC